MKTEESKLRALLEKYNEVILSISSDDFTELPLNMRNGRIGLCVYLYIMSRLTNEKKYETFAETLLDDIYSNINNIYSLTDLVWVGLSLNFFIEQKYAEGNIDVILGDIDSLIFQKTLNPKSTSISESTQMQIIIYLAKRLKRQKEGSNSEFLFQELIIKALNDLYIGSVKNDFYKNPMDYNIEYKVPLLLYTLSEIYKLGFYNYRIDRILHEISFDLLSILPTLHSNRLYLLWGLLRIKQQTQLDIWDEPILTLKSCIKLEKIVFDELKNKCIHIYDGISSILLLIYDINRLSPDLLLLDNRIFQKKIEESVLWNDLDNDKMQIREKLGLFNGLAGVSLISEFIFYNKR